MAQISADEISKLIREQIENYEGVVEVAEVGSIISLGDGIARLHGLEKVMAGEMLEFPHDVAGIAMNLEEDQVGAVLLGEYSELKEGDEVRRTGRIISVPVGEALVGRVVDSLGRPLDGKGPIQTTEFFPVERIAPGVIDREGVKEPMQTGIKAIDGMIPIGRGQRELIIGELIVGNCGMNKHSANRPICTTNSEIVSGVDNHRGNCCEERNSERHWPGGHCVCDRCLHLGRVGARQEGAGKEAACV
jgi:F-type H+-transporting ATPase subunit alpha